MVNEIPRTKRDFENALEALRKEALAQTDNPGSYQSDDCVRCYNCMFTTGSVDCFHCTYCTACTECSHCTHCKDCRGCHSSNYCVSAKNCSNCSYVMFSENCLECVFCFGCVGLVKKEFHILNQRFKRDEYFKIVAELKEAFGI